MVKKILFIALDSLFYNVKLTQNSRPHNQFNVQTGAVSKVENRNRGNLFF